MPALLLASFLLLSCDRSGETGLNPGDLSPEFKLTDLSGSQVSIRDFKGKVVLLNFWATWCEPCVAEMPALEQLYNRLKSEGFVVVAVGTDDTLDNIKDFQAKYSLDFPILFDAGGDIKTKFKVTGVPETFLLDREGRLTMLVDPDAGQPVVRFIGPRNWDSPDIQAQLKDLLSATKPEK
jgi:cytochrome c biogenesis protein CcmG, thiol:disulfide interchange protein DsbE